MQDKKKAILLIALIVLSGLGFLDSLFLSVEHARGVIPPCDPRFKCDVVTTSEYSKLFGIIPLPYLGLAYYLTIFVGSILLKERPGLEKKIANALLAVSGMGLVASSYFTYIQAMILEAWCPYCIASAVFTTLFFLTALFFRKSLQKTDTQKPFA